MSYINLLTKIKNAQAVKKENVKAAYSKMDEAILGILAANRYIDGFEKKGRGPKKFLDIQLKYEDGQPVIDGVKFISRPSRKIYAGYRDLKSVRYGHGLSVVSTPQGVMTNKEARKAKVGGEVLFEIW
ncbi:30S ribosomal protein S8 [Candidatus Wolfebacteria bacterium]|nr:30S ribosomal protein S8 [Candidatus Wolfebacteria bacterium]